MHTGWGKFISIVWKLLLLAALFLTCRLYAERFGWTPGTAPLACIGTTCAWLIAIHCLRRAKELKEEQRLTRGSRAADPELAARMRLSWKRGRAFLKRHHHARTLPHYLALGSGDCAGVIGLPEAPVPEAWGGIGNSEFSWRFGPRAVWLDADFGCRRDDDGRWPLFLRGLATGPERASLRGVAIVLDAERLLAGTEAAVREDAALLAERLDQLFRIAGRTLPAYLLVDRIDMLYGVRTLAAGLNPAILDEPLGAFRENNKEGPGCFAAETIALAAEALFGASDECRRSPAVLQAPAELARLSAPLAQFCAEAFGRNSYRETAELRGVFLGSSGARGETLPPLLVRHSAFKKEKEPAYPARSWFWPALTRDWIADDPVIPSMPTGRGYVQALSTHAGVTSLLACTLVLCWLMTLSFMEAHRALAAVAPTAVPATAGELEALRETIARLSAENNRWFLPRFGMREPERLEEGLRRRYDEAARSLRAGADEEMAFRGDEK